MNHKILVADDSATIQKVVSITLANESYELIEADNADALFEQLDSNQISLVLLDFNLSEELSGYELATTIKEKSPKSKIIAMLGTFDTVEDEKLEGCGIEEFVVKPFESNKFIQSCKRLVSEVAIDEHIVDLVNEEADQEVDLGISSEIDGDPASGWVTNSPDHVESFTDFPTADQIMTNVPNISSNNDNNPLLQELEGWGVEVPSVIGQSSDSIDSSLLPPHITTDNKTLEIETFSSEEDSGDAFSESTSAFITIDDYSLDSDEQDDIDSSNAVEGNVDFTINDQLNVKEDKNEIPFSKPMFHSIDDFKETDESLEDSDDKTEEIHIAQFDLEKEIEEESEGFWAVEDNELEDTENLTIESKIFSHEELATSERVVIEGSDNVDTSKRGELSQEDKDEIINALTKRIRPIIIETLKEMCEKEVDKIAWEVIPDLAENLISKEIKTISDSI